MGFFSKVEDFFQEKVFDPIKEPLRKAVPKELVDVLPIVGGSFGRVLRESLEENTSDQSIFERTLQNAPKDILTNLAIATAILTGGSALGAFGAGGAGAAGAGGVAGTTGTAGAASGGLNLGGLLSTIGEAFGLPAAGVSATGATTAGGGLGSLFGLLGGGGQSQWQQRTDPQGSPYWFDPQGNVTYQDPTGGGGGIGDILSNLLGGGQQQGQQQGFDIGNFLNSLGGGISGLTGEAAAGTTGGQQGLAGLGVEIPPIQTTEDIFQRALGFGREQFPEALGAQAQGIGGLQRLQDIGPEFFERFGPTSLEEATTNELFKRNLEQAKRVAGQRASSAGIETIFPELFAKAISPTITGIGEFLSGRGQQRGLASLEALRAGSQGLTGISPFTDVLSPFVATELNQQGTQLPLTLSNLQRQAGETSARKGLQGGLTGGGLGLLGSQLFPGLGISPQSGFDIGSLLGSTAKGGTLDLGGLFGGGGGNSLFPGTGTQEQLTGLTESVNKLGKTDFSKFGLPQSLLNSLFGGGR